MDKAIYTHFHPDEHPFVDKATEWVERAAAKHAVKLTDFLDPRQQAVLTVLANRSADVANRSADVACRFDGGYEGAERKRAVIVPDYRDPGEETVGIQVLSVFSGEDKFLSLDHGDYMGAILGLGIKRDKIGDIHVLSGGCHCLVAEEIGDFLRLHLRQVHRTRVQTELLPTARLETAESVLEEMALSVASLRLDGIASDVYRLSRTKILAPIKAGRCRVNWKVEEDPSKTLQAGDIVSMHGFGRFKVLEVEGVTKKGRIRVKIGKFI